MTDEQIRLIVEAIGRLQNSIVGLMFLLVGLWIPLVLTIARIASALEKRNER